MTPRIFRYDPTQEGTRRWLGELEDTLMGVLWDEARPMTSAAIARATGKNINTINTTLARLCDKGLARRTEQGRGFAYRAVVTRDDFEAYQINAIEESLP